jgi:phosphatidylglycerophosphate synthase
LDRDRLRRIRNFQSEDWYPALFIRPISIAIMLVIADWRFLTPNRLTTVANVCKLASSWFVYDGETTAEIVAAVVLLQFGLIFDHLDGTMARYRRTFTKMGSFYDKVSDLITWFIISAATGWQAYELTGDAYFIVLSLSSAFALGSMGYMKWLVTAESERLRWVEARQDPTEAIARRTAPVQIAPPPERNARDWVRWFLQMAPRFLKFEETDLYFWVAIGLLLERADLLVWLLFVSQLVVLAAMVAKRSREIADVDRRMRDLGDG